jgi:hypothetical protein
MKVFTQVLTFGATASQVAAASTQPSPANVALTNVSYVYVEALASNTHNSMVGVSSVTNGSTGVGVISQIGIPESTTGTSLPNWELRLPFKIDLAQLWFWGTSGEAVKVTFFTED